jgi:hypothetical protein
MRMGGKEERKKPKRAVVRVGAIAGSPRLHVTVTTMRRWFGVLDACTVHARPQNVAA